MAIIDIQGLKDKEFLKVAKSFILILLVFLSLSFLFAYVFEKHIMKDSLLKREEKQIQQYLAQTKILALGDSHTARCLNTELIDNLFNYASFGEQYLQTYYKLAKVLKQKNQIQTVILQIDFHNLLAKFKEKSNLYFWKNYIDSKELNKSRNKNFLDLIFYEITAKLFTYKSSLRQFLALIKKDSKTELILGYTPRQEQHFSAQEEKTYLKRRINNHFKRSTKFNTTIQEKYFYKILELLEQNNIKVILVSYPISKKYYRASQNYVSAQEFQKQVNKIRKTYTNISAYYNYQNYFWAEQESKYLYDDDHVNSLGAQIISYKIKENLSL